MSAAHLSAARLGQWTVGLVIYAVVIVGLGKWLKAVREAHDRAEARAKTEPVEVILRCRAESIEEGIKEAQAMLDELRKKIEEQPPQSA